MRILGLVLVLVTASAAAAAGSARAPARPTVVGPRETVSVRPVFRFRAARATRFLCAFDSRRLRPCRARYSRRLSRGAHILRVRAVGPGGRSPITTVRVRVLAPLPPLPLGPRVSVGPGAGMPAAAGGALWVPTTLDGTVARVVGGTVVSRTPVGPASAGITALDTAVAGGSAVWSASDEGNRIARIDPATGSATRTFRVATRPGGLAYGGGAVWAFHFRDGTVTRIDESSQAATTWTVPGVSGTGIAFGEGSVWLLSAGELSVRRLDPATGAVQRSVSLRPPFPSQGGNIETWWLAFGDGAVWATLPSYGTVVRIDPATGRTRYVRLRHGEIDYAQPFGIAVGGGSAWVGTDRAVLRLDAATGRLLAASLRPSSEQSRFVSMLYADGAAWLTNFTTGTLAQVGA